MKVTLLHNTPLDVCAHAIRTCWQSFHLSDGGDKDKELIDRVGNKFKHASTLEHLSYTFYIQGISRACLQEVARHRIASYSVKSTRYTLKELAKADDIALNADVINKFLVMSEDIKINALNIEHLARVQELARKGVSNDVLKYALPEAYKTELTMTINARSLQNFLTLRTSKSALDEIRQLANLLFSALPETHLYLFAHCVQEH